MFTPIGFYAAQATGIITQNLALYLDFKDGQSYDGTGVDVTDLSTNAFTLTGRNYNGGTITDSTLSYQNNLYIDLGDGGTVSNSDFIELSNNTAILPESEDYTMQHWLNLDAAWVYDQSKTEFISCIFEGTELVFTALRDFQSVGYPEIRWVVRDTNSNISSNNIRLDDYVTNNEWFLFTGTIDRTTNEQKVYINDTLVATGTTTFTGTIAPNTDYAFGARADTTAANDVGLFHGFVGKNMIYKGKALTAEEVATNYNNTKDEFITDMTGLLDTYPNAYAAWSLRKLRNYYSGDAIQVTRTSDSATQDIGFVGEDLDTDALTTFIGANTGVVSKWYDQSGNSRDITIASAQRPTIVSSGTLQTLSGGKPTMKPQSGQLGVDTGISGLTDKSIFFAGDTTNILGGTNASRVLSSYAGTGGVGSDYIISHYNGSPSFIRLFDQSTTATQYLDRGEIVVGTYASSGTIGIKANEYPVDTSTGTAAANPNNYHLFEDRGGAINNEIPAFASEYVIYDTSKDSDLQDITSNINTYYNVWTPPPTEIFSDAQYWWRADLGVGKSGTTVTSWTDVINGFEMVTEGRTSPQLGTDSTLNNQSVIEFDGDDALYTLTTPASRTGDFTMFVVFNSTVDDEGNAIFGLSRRPAELATTFLMRANGGDFSNFTRRFDSNTGGFSSTIVAGADSTGAHTMFSRYIAADGQVNIALDSLTEVEGTGNGFTNQDWYAPDGKGMPIAAGAWVNNTIYESGEGLVYDNRYFNGSIAECVIVYGSPSSEELTAWKNYVNARYGTIIS